MSNYQSLEVWQLGHSFVISVYKEIALWRNYGIKNQFEKASLSITNNIAEAADRFTPKEKIRFFVISRGSAMECENMIHVVKDLELISEETAKLWLDQIKSICKLQNGYIKYLQKHI